MMSGELKYLHKSLENQKLDLPCSAFAPVSRTNAVDDRAPFKPSWTEGQEEDNPNREKKGSEELTSSMVPSGFVPVNVVQQNNHSLESDAVAHITIAPFELVSFPQLPGTHKKVPTKSAKAVATSTDGTFSSIFRGVTRHKMTGKFEAHFWDSSFKRPNAGKSGRRRGKQVYLGGYSSEEAAARAWDKASLIFNGPLAKTNFPAADYFDFLAANVNRSPYEIVSEIRRASGGFSRGRSNYRGVTKQGQKWEARVTHPGTVRNLYVGVYDSPEAAARAYDAASIMLRGEKAVTNFPFEDYAEILGDRARCNDFLQCTEELGLFERSHVDKEEEEHTPEQAQHLPSANTAKLSEIDDRKAENRKRASPCGANEALLSPILGLATTADPCPSLWKESGLDKILGSSQKRHRSDDVWAPLQWP